MKATNHSLISVIMCCLFVAHFVSAFTKTKETSLDLRSTQENDSLNVLMFKTEIEKSILDNDEMSLRGGVDGMLRILSDSQNIYQKGDIAQYLVDLITGESVFRYSAKIRDNSPVRQMLVRALQHQDHICSRVNLMIKLRTGELLSVPGNEVAAIAQVTHYRCVFLGDLIIRNDIKKTFTDYYRSDDSEVKKNLNNFYKDHCTG